MSCCVGLLGSSILGFHTQLHCNNFLDSVDRYLETRIDQENHAVVMQGHRTLVRPYPISLEWPVHWVETAPSIEECRAQVWQDLGLKPNALLGIGVDRLDYTKGIEERLLAVEVLLERHREYRGRFSFAQLAAPSRTKIQRYRELNETVEQLAERINARFGTKDYQPIILFRSHHEPPEVFRFYRAADLCYVSSLHDGMNLVAKEFVAARTDLQGVLLLSEFTGAARELTEALIVNPYDLAGSAEAIASGLAMSRRRATGSYAIDAVVPGAIQRIPLGRNHAGGCGAATQSRACGRTPRRGARAHGASAMAMKHLLSRTSLPLVTRLARKRTLCAFDFDGTLAPIADHPDRAVMRQRTRDLLRRLASLYPCIVVSGRNRASVLKKLNGVRVAGVLGNHGAESSRTTGSRKDVKRWRAALELELGLMPGMWIEDKETCLAIHYRQSPQKAESAPAHPRCGRKTEKCSRVRRQASRECCGRNGAK